MIEPVPEDSTGAGASQPQDLEVEADSYQAAVSAVHAQVPEGWRVMNLRRESD